MLGIYFGFAVFFGSVILIAYALGGPLAVMGLFGVWTTNAILNK